MFVSIVNNIFSQASYIKSLNDEELAQYKAETKEKWESAQEHNRKLELTEAARPRNFWGK